MNDDIKLQTSAPNFTKEQLHTITINTGTCGVTISNDGKVAIDWHAIDAALARRDELGTTVLAIYLALKAVKDGTWVPMGGSIPLADQPRVE